MHSRLEAIAKGHADTHAALASHAAAVQAKLEDHGAALQQAGRWSEGDGAEVYAASLARLESQLATHAAAVASKLEDHGSAVESRLAETHAAAVARWEHSDALSALNVSNAAAVAAYEWARQRPK